MRLEASLHFCLYLGRSESVRQVRTAVKKRLDGRFLTVLFRPEAVVERWLQDESHRFQ